MDGITVPEGFCRVDERNVKLAKSGDKTAFSQLILYYKQDLYRVAKGILKSDFDAADAIQETIISAYSNISSLKDDQYFKTWIIRILINQCSRILRNAKQTVSIDEITELAATDRYPSDNDAAVFINMLVPDLRYVIILYYYEDFSVKEIAGILKIPQGTVKSRLQRARAKLLQLMSAKGDDQNEK